MPSVARNIIYYQPPLRWNTPPGGGMFGDYRKGYWKGCQRRICGRERCKVIISDTRRRLFYPFLSRDPKFPAQHFSVSLGVTSAYSVITHHLLALVNRQVYKSRYPYWKSYHLPLPFNMLSVTALCSKYSFCQKSAESLLAWI